MYLRFGLLGEKISYSLSPAIFEKLLRAANLSGEYRLYDLSQHRAAELLRQERLEWAGLNVTTPHKSLAANFCDILSSSARKIAAVNVVSMREGRLSGDNTDVDGFRFAFKRLFDGKPLPGHVLVIGSGGAARAVLYVLNEVHQQANVEIASSAPENVQQNLESLKLKFATLAFAAHQDALCKLPEYDLVIQCTPLGSAKLPGCPLGTSLKFSRSATVMDLVYVPSRTPFLRYAEESGARVANGLTMLIAQAIASLEIWTGIQLSTDQIVNTLLPQLEKND